MNISNPKHNKKCPSCGTLFVCTGDEDCWCENYQIHKKDYYRMTIDFKECICENCLKNYAEE